jgi:fluoride exporter
VLAGLVRPPGEDPLSPHVRLLLATGFCGGFTTYSFFAYQSLLLVQMGRPAAALAYTLGSPVLGLAAVWAGYRLARGQR